MVEYRRDVGELGEILKQYTPAGMPVQMQTFGDGIIESQIGFAQGTFFKVVLNEPIHFDRYADAVGASSEKMTRKEIEKKWSGRTLPFTEEDIERGMSEREILLHTFATNCSDCLDEGMNIVKVVIPWDRVQVHPLQAGQLVEFVETDSEHVSGIRVWIGRIVGASKNKEVVYLESFEPVPMAEAPESISPEDVQPGFISSKTWAIEPDTYRAWAKVDPDGVPHGTLSENKKEYRLDEPVELDAVKGMCKKHYKDDFESCWHQAAILFVIPIEVRYQGVFRPLRASEEMADYYYEWFYSEEGMGL